MFHCPSQTLLNRYIFPGYGGRKIAKDTTNFIYLYYLIFMKKLSNASHAEAFKRRNISVSSEDVAKAAVKLASEFSISHRMASRRDHHHSSGSSSSSSRASKEHHKKSANKIAKNPIHRSTKNKLSALSKKPPKPRLFSSSQLEETAKEVSTSDRSYQSGFTLSSKSLSLNSSSSSNTSPNTSGSEMS